MMYNTLSHLLYLNIGLAAANTVLQTTNLRFGGQSGPEDSVVPDFPLGLAVTWIRRGVRGCAWA